MTKYKNQPPRISLLYFSTSPLIIKIIYTQHMNIKRPKCKKYTVFNTWLNESAENFIGRVDATIWIEGWDYSVIDEEIAHAFDLGLTFEINKIGAGS